MVATRWVPSMILSIGVNSDARRQHGERGLGRILICHRLWRPAGLRQCLLCADDVAQLTEPPQHRYLTQLRLDPFGYVGHDSGKPCRVPGLVFGVCPDRLNVANRAVPSE